MWELDAAGFLSFVCFRGLSEALCLVFSVEKLKLGLQLYSILQYLNQFGCPLSPALWTWPKSVACPASSLTVFAAVGRGRVVHSMVR